jgi:Family of unknown function (DUF6308)
MSRSAPYQIPNDAVPNARKKTEPSTRANVCAAYLLGDDSELPFRGRNFHIGHAANPDEFTQVDLFSLKALSVGRNLRVGQFDELRNEGCNGILAKIKKSWILEKMPDYLTHQNADPATGKPSLWNDCETLWVAVKNVNQFGGLVVRSKLLARKRPNLFPIIDDRVVKALGLNKGSSYWGTFQAVMRDDEVSKNLDEIWGELMHKAPQDPAIQDLTRLRILDICLWML